ncbi:sensor domain-containing protein [Nocardia sp. BMG111209]|uniref:sensor domain-containing protein n=1 Tax=Nocardia sp. BMG111209 TaxID=1160137 RepID=UPI00036ADD83|nr:sensor domain-containing protein [Nocardia sp. BMG111209]
MGWRPNGFAVGVVSAVLIGVTGCSAVGGSAAPDYPAGSIDAALMNTHDAGGRIGAALWFRTDAGKPGAAQTVTPAECQAAATPASDLVFGNSWTDFRLSTFQENANTWDHSLTQAVGRYENADRARDAFTKLTQALMTCGDKEIAVLRGAGAVDSKWRNHIDTSSADTVWWNAEQLDATGWRCYREARLKQAVLLQVALCQSGNGQPAATAIADKVAAKL